MKTCVAVLLLIFSGLCLPQSPLSGAPLIAAAYPESEASAAWRGLAASYVRKAVKDQTLNRDPELNARIDRVMATVGAATAAIDPRFAKAEWKAIMIERFGYGAAAFPGETILVDAHFVRTQQLGDDELALMLSHEVVHVIARHTSAKLAFMAETLGKDKVPTAGSALLEYLTSDSYAHAYRPTEMLQEREADAMGAVIFFATGYDTQRALRLFDKLAALEALKDDPGPDSHDRPAVRKQAIAGVIAELENIDARRDTDSTASTGNPPGTTLQ